ncbi:MAG: hypothetical protein OJF61_001458 [Rhodanobacteraceae bacterium]|jgi:APA family basic amino acid/polyamine antiporter|nr:MAG: hypothetical protein OJF61_001458 [Rhodanobacteraceae bacterium]
MSSVEAGLAEGTSPNRLLRVLGLGFGIAVVVGGMIGTGILRAPGPIAALLNDPVLIITVWLASGLYVLLGVNTKAELATSLPQAGGNYVYARRAFGGYGGFVIGWADWLIWVAAASAMSVAFAEFVGELVPALAGHIGATAVATIAAFVLLHYTGVRSGSLAQQLTSALKVLGLIAFVAACFWFGEGAPSRGAAAAPAAAPSNWLLFLGSVLVAMQMVNETYAGWDSAVYFAEENTNPGRNLPRAMFGGALVVIGVYVLINLAYLHVLPLDRFRASKLPAADAMHAVFGGHAAQIVYLLAALSLLAIINSAFMCAPRVLYGLGRDGMFAAQAQRVSAGGTPVVALLITGAAVVIALAFGKSFERLFLIAAFFGTSCDAAVAIALFVLRRREPVLPRPFRAFAYPIAPLLFALIATAVFVSFLFHDPTGSLFALAALAAAYPLYWWMRRKRRWIAQG